MASTLQIKKSVYGASAGAPASLLYGELAWDNAAGKLYIGKQTASNTVTVTELEVNLPDATSSTKGKASFSTNNFVVNSGAVQIKDGGVVTAELAADAVTGAKLADDAVDSEHIADGAVDLAHMSANSVDSDQYVDGSIDTAHIANDAVTGAKLANSITIAQDLTVSGNLTVSGTTTTVNTTNTTVSDPLLELNSGAGSNANDCGLIIERGSTGDNATIFFDESADKWTLGTTTATASSTGNMSGFTKGALVANIDSSTMTNVTIDLGTYAN
tara:strand:- start:639 stop:1454 length:816 start_codon:yes stop_codon:yes gene_type:complete